MEILKSNKIRVTRAREAIIDIIIALNKPFSVNELYAIYLQKNTTEITTIYRFIVVLAEKKIIRDIGNFNNTQYYELACVHNPLHPHFFCNVCHKIQCLKQLSTDDFIRLSGYVNNNTINEVKIIMAGICEKCKNID